MKTVLRVLPGLAVAIFWILPAVSSIVYQNDFSVRHSDGAIPSGAWRSVSYTPGWLAHYGENAAFAVTFPDGLTVSFSAFVKSYGFSNVEVEGVVHFTAVLCLSGAVNVQ